jgi:hypothetical protein
MNLHAEYLFGSNIASVFKKYHVPQEFDYLSCDMDSFDQWVLRGILEGGYRPRVISSEFNSNWGIESPFSFEDPTMSSER